MTDKRKICVVTGTRSEYGLLYWLMRAIEGDDLLILQLVVTGMHLSPEFGLTYKVIEQDGFTIDYKVEMLLSSDTPTGIAKSIGVGVMGFTEAFTHLKPDIVVILGDRYEALAAAQVAMTLKIPLAHIHGGETTEGAMDEAIRHSITKMAQLHFTAAEQYARRVVQLGEAPERVLNVGALGVENITRLNLLDRKDFERSIEFALMKKNFLVTYHPVTLSNEKVEKSVEKLLAALDSFSQVSIIFTKANSDAGGRVINNLLEQYAAKDPDRIKVFTSLGQLLYLSAIKHSDLVIGNSSSGILEVPFLKKPTVNIGDRQKGRLRPATVIDCAEDTSDIINAIHKALSPEFKAIIEKAEYPFGDGNVAGKIKESLKNVCLDGILQKKFFDIGEQL